MKYDVIMPIYIRAFFCSEDIHLLCNIIDKHNDSEVLLHQVVKDGKQWGYPQVVTKLDCCQFSYRIFQNYKSNLVILNTMLSGVYQLISRTFHITEGRWGKEEVVHSSLLPYQDFSFYVEENRKHYLFITKDDQVNRVIYQYKEVGLQKNTILFQHEKIDSCLLILSNKILWALWICDNKLYGCFSKNYGENFSSSRVYKQFDNESPVKVLYQEYLANGHIFHETYVINSNREEKLFLQDLLKDVIPTGLDRKGNLKAEIENVDYKIEGVKDYFTKMEILEEKKEELEEKLKKLEEEMKRLNKTIELEKSQITNLQYQLYKEKEKIKLYKYDNDKLKEKNGFLERKLLLKDKEKISIEKELVESKKEWEGLKQQLNAVRVQNLTNSESCLKKSTNDGSKQSKFSLVKWLFDDGNN